MADPQNPATKSADANKNAGLIKHLQFKRKELVDKLERFKDHKNTEDHDFDALRKRAENGIKEIEDEIKHLGGSVK
jgi:ElaB/YqjD/DUF883 family membrane-anchored ribosome-binding protein